MRPWFPTLVLLLLAPSVSVADVSPPEGVRVPSTVSAETARTAMTKDGEASPSLVQPVDLSALVTEPLPAGEGERIRGLSAQMHAELAALDEAIREQVAALESAIQKTAAGAVPGGPEFDREIEALKRSLAVESLVIQARYAREVGAETLAAEIDAAVERMLNPVTDTTTVDRTPRPRHRAAQR